MKEPWKSPGAKKWDSMTIEHWLQSMKCDAMAADFFRQVIITVLCAESYEVNSLKDASDTWPERVFFPRKKTRSIFKPQKQVLNI